MRVRVVTIIKGGGQQTSPCNRCAQSAGVFLGVLVCLCACYYYVFWRMGVVTNGITLHLAIVVRNQQVCFSVFFVFLCLLLCVCACESDHHC